VVEGLSFGNPTFRAGRKKRAFLVLDRYRGQDCLWFRVDPGRRDELLADPRFFPAPYDPRQTALCRTLTHPNWRQIIALIKYSYSSVN
jgi:predicted DNA-binding protein (MmcQ/YjbR family)